MNTVQKDYYANKGQVLLWTNYKIHLLQMTE